MKKTITLFLTFILIFCTFFCVPALSAQAAVYEPDRKIYAKAYMLINLDDASYPVVAEKNQDEKMFPASLTKIVTAMVVLENVTDLSKKTKVSKTAFDSLLGTGAQVAGLQIGDEITIEQLLYLAMVHSACDACAVLAEYVGGSIENFVVMTNEWVRAQGCKNTNLMNVDGLHDDNHYTTASDMAKITLKALQNETFVKIADTVTFSYKNINFYHTNLMLRSGYVSYYYKYATGIKTGSTSEADYCVVTKASKDGYNYLAVVLGSPRIDYNKDGIIEKCSFIDAGSLFNWAFSSLKYSTLIEQNEIVSEVAVKNGKDADTVQLVAKEDITTIVPSSLDISAIMIEPQNKPESIEAPVKKGQEVCTANIIYGEETIATVSLIASKDVELSTFLKILNAIKAFFGLTVVKIIIIAAVLFLLAYVYLVYKNYLRKKKRREEKMRQYEEMQNGADDDLPPPRRR